MNERQRREIDRMVVMIEGAVEKLRAEEANAFELNVITGATRRVSDVMAGELGD